MIKADMLATISPHDPKYWEISQAGGRAAREPQVPGAFGKYPDPNQVAISTPGSDRLGFAADMGDGGSDLSIFDV